MIASLILLITIGLISIIITAIVLVVLAEKQHDYGVKSITLNGEEVKSIGERRIADYFAKNNINYVYEKEARTKGFFGSKISNPDFYLPDHDVYVEYWGLVDADDWWTRNRYVRNMKRKMAIYYKNNIKFISIYPRNMDNLDWIFRKKFQKVTGYKLPD